MARKRVWVMAVLIGLVTTVAIGASRDDLWRQVDEAINKGLPKTAAEVLDQIIPGALADQAYAEATKAICLKIVQEVRIQGNKSEERITRLQAQVATAPEAMKPVMETMLAHWFWQYFQANRYRFLQRTQTAQAPGEDFTTWDLARILAEIDKHFTLALAAEAQLKATPIAQWDDLIEKGTMPDKYRPTLYDFLVYEALSFYSSGEQAALPEDVFEIMADSPIFAPVAEFLAWEPSEISDLRSQISESAKLKAVRLYQSLLRFHLDDSDRRAFADADLHRLDFGSNQAIGPEKNDLYAAALERFVNEWQGYDVAAMGLYEWANALYQQGDYVRAHELASEGWEAYPTSFGGMFCHELILQIEAKSASVSTERVWNDPLPKLQVTYRNVSKVYFRAVPYDFAAFARTAWEVLTPEEETALLAAQPALQWNEVLPVTADFKQRTEQLAAPQGLAKGFYVILASHDSSFKSSTNNQISFSPVWVSDLALVIRNISGSRTVEGFVLDARSGEPIAGATVTRWLYATGKNPTARYVPGDQTTSDQDGLFRFTSEVDTWSSFLIVAEYGGDKLASENNYSTGAASRDPLPYEQTVFFTDRSLYRPGQTIYYKGICIRVDQTADSYQTLAGRQVTVVFRDTNGKEIARQDTRSNDYGSFSGSFTAPEDRLTGQMYLAVISGPAGSANFNVEEYKRPKFMVQLDPPVDAPRLNAEVVVPGKATAYTGASIGGAQVEWRVVRQVRYPVWNWWRRGVATSASQAIAHGTSVTGSDGSFSVKFTAKPDLSVAEEDEPVFTFAIYADVTDTTGETRSAGRTVSVGYTALQAALSAAEWQTPASPVELTVTTQSLDGVPEPAQGKISVYAFKQPDKVIRPSLSSSGSTPDASNPLTWELAELIREQDFSTGADGSATVSVALGAGVYRAMLATQDRFGKAVTAQQTITVVDPQATRFALRIANHFAAPRWSVEPGETFVALWGTGYDAGRAYVELECRGEVLQAWWTDSARTQEVISQEVTESMRGGFTLRTTYVRENRAYIHEQIVDVPWTNKDLILSWEHFTSLLEPG
ncbi:MAG: MG2 domain-containing protein, partial [Phycisphaerales bacterium]